MVIGYLDPQGKGFSESLLTKRFACSFVGTCLSVGLQAM